MSDIPYKNKMDPKAKAIAIIILLLIIGMIAGLVISKVGINYAIEQNPDVNPRLLNLIGTLYTISVSIFCINISLLLGLLWIYADSFRKTKSSFMLGLLLFIGVLFVQSVLSLIIFPLSLGENLSLYEILPNMLESIALVILLYLSME
jgi:hypothetical protein